MFGFGRSRDGGKGSTAISDAPVEVRPGSKGRATPKRSQAQARNQRPLVPTDRKAAVRASRAQAREQRSKTRQALMTGDDAHLPPRDKGPVRRHVRDYVDARWNVGEFFLIVALLVVGLTLIPDPRVFLVMTLLLWTTVVACILDGFLLARGLRRHLVAKFGEEMVPKGTVSYGVLRAFQLRRTRLPKPQVKHGQRPD